MSTDCQIQKIQLIHAFIDCIYDTFCGATIDEDSLETEGFISGLMEFFGEFVIKEVFELFKVSSFELMNNYFGNPNNHDVTNT